MSRDNSIVAVVPTFQPTPSLLDLLGIARPHVCSLVVSDDASPCTSDHLLRLARNEAGVSVIHHDHNVGIARGLNDGLAAAVENDATWLLTLDQDTIISTDYIPKLMREARRRIGAGLRLGALGAALIHDGRSTLSYPTNLANENPTTEELIQAGTLWNTPALSKIGGFSEVLAMDAVDAAACLALRELGYEIGIAPDLTITHRIGNSTSIRIAGRSVMVTRHSPKRRTTMLRNRLRLFPGEFRQSPRHAFRTVRRVLVNNGLGLILEPGRWENVKASARALAIRDGR